MGNKKIFCGGLKLNLITDRNTMDQNGKKKGQKEREGLCGR